MTDEQLFALMESFIVAVVVWVGGADNSISFLAFSRPERFIWETSCSCFGIYFWASGFSDCSDCGWKYHAYFEYKINLVKQFQIKCIYKNSDLWLLMSLSVHVYVLQVTWIRHRDLHLLTVNRFTYTSDQRFSAIHNPMTEEWTLQIRYPQQRDAGIYECQVGTTPPIGHSVWLSVVGKWFLICIGRVKKILHTRWINCDCGLHNITN